MKMIAVIQRVRQASVRVGHDPVAEISRGLVVLLGIAHGDTSQDVDFMVGKISRLRIFPDEQGKMQKSLQEIQGEILVVSQFTLLANTGKGRRPSFELAASPEEARKTYQEVLEKFQAIGLSVREGTFGASMVVSLENDGPVTLILDSRTVETVKRLRPHDAGPISVRDRKANQEELYKEREGRA